MGMRRFTRNQCILKEDRIALRSLQLLPDSQEPADVTCMAAGVSDTLRDMEWIIGLIAKTERTLQEAKGKF